MHQTFYIDIDEEISSVIDRLHKSMSTDNYFVVPKRALFLQSIVNLKILKREADKMSKNVILVSQDESAISMAQRSGIDVRATIDGLEPVKQSYEEIEEDDDEFEEEEIKVIKSHKHDRLKNLGSGEFHDSSATHSRDSLSNHKNHPIKSVHRAKAANSVAVKHKNKPTLFQQPKKAEHYKAVSKKTDLDPAKAMTLEKLYSGQEKKKSQTDGHKVGSKKFKNIFIGFMILCMLVFTGVAVYLFVPNAKVVLMTDVSKKKIDMDVKAQLDSIDENDIPLKVIEKQENFIMSFDSTGYSEATGKKARGKVVVYNEFSNEPQTLIATTRLESEDGKIYRLVKNTVVPGLTDIDGKKKPGAIEADIIADRAGDAYNIESGKFKIPGFEGGPKYDKFYANAEKIEGGSGGAEAESKAVIQTDIDGAKQKTEKAFSEKMVELVNEQLANGEVALVQAQKVTIEKSASTTKVGAMTDKFDYIVSGNIKALVFSENNLKSLIRKSIEKNRQENADFEISKIDYGSVEADFDVPSLKLKVYGESSSAPVINTDEIKEQLLGKSDYQLAEVLRKYPSVKNANVEFSPSFVTRIPQFSSRVSVEVQEKAN